jgi:hypothetical protein
MNWALSFGGPSGADAAYDIAFHPVTGEIIAGGSFNKAAAFGLGNTAAASFNKEPMETGFFLATLAPVDGAVERVDVFPSDSTTVSGLKLAADKDGMYVAATARGALTLYIDGNKHATPALGAGAAVFKVDYEGKVRECGCTRRFLCVRMWGWGGEEGAAPLT